MGSTFQGIGWKQPLSNPKEMLLIIVLGSNNIQNGVDGSSCGVVAMALMTHCEISTRRSSRLEHDFPLRVTRQFGREMLVARPFSS